jgi:hypothetical protein
LTGQGGPFMIVNKKNYDLHLYFTGINEAVIPLEDKTKRSIKVKEK